MSILRVGEEVVGHYQFPHLNVCKFVAIRIVILTGDRYATHAPFLAWSKRTFISEEEIDKFGSGLLHAQRFLDERMQPYELWHGEWFLFLTCPRRHPTGQHL